MNEFEKQMLQMMQELKADIQNLQQGQEEIKERLDRLEAKVDDNFATVIDGVATIAEGLGDEQVKQTKRTDTVESVVSRILFDVAALKQKVG